ncbi:MAG: hypothetical protein KJ606_04380 [Chloroflexi bacterium]|nr:hypothetical protein [Chloroflexota bacterium]
MFSLLLLYQRRNALQTQGFGGALATLDMATAAPFVALIFVFLGLRRPHTRLKARAKRRAELMRNNMLIGLSVLNALISSGVGVQEALRRTAGVGGPFRNLLSHAQKYIRNVDEYRALHKVPAPETFPFFHGAPLEVWLSRRLRYAWDVRQYVNQQKASSRTGAGGAPDKCRRLTSPEPAASSLRPLDLA